MTNKRVFKSNNTIVYSCKSRRKMLANTVDIRPKEIIQEVVDDLRCEIGKFEEIPEHAHLLCEVDPQWGIHRISYNRA